MCKGTEYLIWQRSFRSSPRMLMAFTWRREAVYFISILVERMVCETLWEIQKTYWTVYASILLKTTILMTDYTVFCIIKTSFWWHIKTSMPINRNSSIQQTNDRNPKKDQTTRWFCPSKKVYRIEVFHFVTIHLDMCSKLLLLFILIFFFSRIFHLRFIMYCTPYLLCILMQFTHADV